MKRVVVFGVVFAIVAALVLVLVVTGRRDTDAVPIETGSDTGPPGQTARDDGPGSKPVHGAGAPAEGPPPPPEVPPAQPDPDTDTDRVRSLLKDLSRIITEFGWKSVRRDLNDAEKERLVGTLEAAFPDGWVRALCELCRSHRGKEEEAFAYYVFSRLGIGRAEACVMEGLTLSGGKNRFALNYMLNHATAASAPALCDLITRLEDDKGSAGLMKTHVLPLLYTILTRVDRERASRHFCDRFLSARSQEERQRLLQFFARAATEEQIAPTVAVLSMEKDRSIRALLIRALGRMGCSRSEEVDALAQALGREASPQVRSEILSLLSRKTPSPGAGGPRLSKRGSVKTTDEDGAYLTGTMKWAVTNANFNIVLGLEGKADRVPEMTWEPGWQDRILGPIERALAADPDAEVRAQAIASLSHVAAFLRNLPDRHVARERISAALRQAAEKAPDPKTRDAARKTLEEVLKGPD